MHFRSKGARDSCRSFPRWFWGGPRLDAPRIFWAWCLGGKGAPKTGEVASAAASWNLNWHSREEEPGLAAPLGSPRDRLWCVSKGLGESGSTKSKTGVKKNFVKIKRRNQFAKKSQTKFLSTYTHKIVKEKCILMNGTFHKEFFFRQISEATEMKRFFFNFQHRSVSRDRSMFQSERGSLYLKGHNYKV